MEEVSILQIVGGKSMSKYLAIRHGMWGFLTMIIVLLVVDAIMSVVHSPTKLSGLDLILQIIFAAIIFVFIILFSIFLALSVKMKKILKEKIPVYDAKIRAYFDACKEGKSVPYGDIQKMAISPAVFYALDSERFQFGVVHAADADMRKRVNGFIEIIRPLILY